MIDDVAWFVALVDRGHKPVLDHNGDLDTCVLARDIHNGPGCSECGWSACTATGSRASRSAVRSSEDG
jgi:hypothetical protein